MRNEGVSAQAENILLFPKRMIANSSVAVNCTDGEQIETDPLDCTGCELGNTVWQVDSATNIGTCETTSIMPKTLPLT